MRFYEGAIPCGIACSRWQNSSGVVVRGIAGAGDNVAVTRAKPGIVRSVLGEYLEVKVASQIEQSFKSNTAEAPVSGSRAWKRDAAAGQVGGRSNAIHRIAADSLNTQFSRAEGLAPRDESGVGILTVR